MTPEWIVLVNFFFELSKLVCHLDSMRAPIDLFLTTANNEIIYLLFVKFTVIQLIGFVLFVLII